MRLERYEVFVELCSLCLAMSKAWEGWETSKSFHHQYEITVHLCRELTAGYSQPFLLTLSHKLLLWKRGMTVAHWRPCGISVKNSCEKGVLVP